jgi:hypothetical protein
MWVMHSPSRERGRIQSLSPCRREVFYIPWKVRSADRGRLISEQIEVVRGDEDFPDGLFGLFTNSVAAFVECCADGSNF